MASILPEAIALVSDGGKMIFSMRSLFYAVRQIFLTRFYVCSKCGGELKYVGTRTDPDLFQCQSCKAVLNSEELQPKYPKATLYEYNTFTQDFLRSYEKRFGKIKKMFREERGEFTYPTERGESHSNKVGGKSEIVFLRGIGNKIILVEKSGTYANLVENRFDLRLDTMILTTLGFSIEKARELLEQAEKEITICVLHDFDINGLLIKETLTKPTKRLDVFIEKSIDLGLNWDIVSRLMEEKALIPEPVELEKTISQNWKV